MEKAVKIGFLHPEKGGLAIPPRAQWTEATERRRQIIEAALPVFASQSYTAATTADIARAAGISQSTIFKHFATKRDLFLAVLDRTTELVLERWQEALQASPTPLDGLVAIIHTYAMMAATEHLAFRVRVRAVAESADPLIAERARDSYLTIVGFLREVIARAQEAGQLPAAVDPAAAAWYVLAMGQGFNLNHYVGFAWDTGTMQAIIGYLFRGLGTEAGSRAPLRPLPPAAQERTTHGAPVPRQTGQGHQDQIAEKG